MRISELAQRAGVPVGTVKYYLREGLLPAGTPTAATQATYDERHVERLGLIRVLVGVGGLSIAATAAVLRAIDDPPSTMHELLGTVHSALGSSARDAVHTDAPQQARQRARHLIARWGWTVRDEAPALDQLAAALQGIEAVGLPDTDALIDRYAELMADIAEVDVAAVPAISPVDAVRFVAAGTILLEPLMLALRRLAQENASSHRFGDRAAHHLRERQ